MSCISKSYRKKGTGPAIFAELLVWKSTWPKKKKFCKKKVSLNCFSSWCDILFWVSSLENVEFMHKIVRFFLLKFALIPCCAGIRLSLSITVHNNHDDDILSLIEAKKLALESCMLCSAPLIIKLGKYKFRKVYLASKEAGFALEGWYQTEGMNKKRMKLITLRGVNAPAISLACL